MMRLIILNVVVVIHKMVTIDLEVFVVIVSKNFSLMEVIRVGDVMN